MLTEAHTMASSITIGKLTKVWPKKVRTKALATNCIHDLPQTERCTPMCLKAEGENIPWGQKAEEPTMELDSSIACKSICYLVSQGKNSMRKSEDERAYGTTHIHKQHWAYPIKLQSNRKQLTKRKKKKTLLWSWYFLPLLQLALLEAVGDSKGMLTPTVTQKGLYTLVPKHRVTGSPLWTTEVQL